MKKNNLKNWRMGSELRDQLVALEESMNTLCQENESLREQLEIDRDEMKYELMEELRYEYEEKLLEIQKENACWKERCAALQNELDDLDKICKQMKSDNDKRMRTLREVMGCTVNNISGNYIENQDIHE